MPPTKITRIKKVNGKPPPNGMMSLPGVPLQKVAEPIEPDYGADEDEDIVDDVDEDEVEGETDS